MPQAPIIPGPAETDDQHRLEQLEAVIARGIAAYDERNRIIVRLVEGGEPKVSVMRRLNRVRERVGVPGLTLAAITQTLRRVEARETVEK